MGRFTSQRVLVAAIVILLKALVQAKTARAVFNNAGVTGALEFSQDSEFSTITAKLEFQGLNNEAGGYHVHNWPVGLGGSGYLLNSYTNGCSAAETGGHFDPLGTNTGVGYNCSSSDPLACEIGDLSGRWGSLANQTEFSLESSETGTGLSLFGENSIVGRSIVVHKQDGSRWVCATIVAEEMNLNKRIVSKFEYSDDFYGTFTFFQGTGLVLVDVRSKTDLSGESISWRLAEEELITSEENCDQISGNESEATEVNSSLKFSKNSGTEWSSTKAVVNLDSVTFNEELLSKSSIIVKSETSGRTFCSVVGKIAVATFNSNGITGAMKFHQLSADQPVNIWIALDGLGERANAFHVHEFPTDLASPADCSLTGGHFNPLAVAGGAGQTGEYSCSRSNLGACEAGDLAGKHGGLAGLNSVDWQFIDGPNASTFSGLNLHGENSIVGRSIVIHNVDGSRLTCSNIEATSSLREVAWLKSTEDEVSGYISVMQSRFDPGEETAVFVHIWDSNQTQSEDHLWHVHTGAVDESSIDRCGSTGGHFNPAGVNGGAGFSDDFAYKCGAEEIGLCEIGDLAGKLSTIDLPSEHVFSAENLPLSGAYSIAGRSVVVHGANLAGKRIGCATLEPFVVENPSPSVKSEYNDGKVVVSVTVGVLCLVGIILLVLVVRQGK